LNELNMAPHHQYLNFLQQGFLFRLVIKSEYLFVRDISRMCALTIPLDIAFETKITALLFGGPHFVLIAFVCSLYVTLQSIRDTLIEQGISICSLMECIGRFLLIILWIAAVCLIMAFASTAMLLNVMEIPKFSRVESNEYLQELMRYTFSAQTAKQSLHRIAAVNYYFLSVVVEVEHVNEERNKLIIDIINQMARARNTAPHKLEYPDLGFLEIGNEGVYWMALIVFMFVYTECMVIGAVIWKQYHPDIPTRDRYGSDKIILIIIWAVYEAVNVFYDIKRTMVYWRCCHLLWFASGSDLIFRMDIAERFESVKTMTAVMDTIYAMMFDEIGISIVDDLQRYSPLTRDEAEIVKDYLVWNMLEYDDLSFKDRMKAITQSSNLSAEDDQFQPQICRLPLQTSSVTVEGVAGELNGGSYQLI